MKLSLQQHIYFFILSSCLFFVVLVSSILWSIHVVDVAIERERYAHKVENHSNVLKQFIRSENIYAKDHNIDQWLLLEAKFNELLTRTPSLSAEQKTIQYSIESQNKLSKKLFSTVLKARIKMYLKFLMLFMEIN